MVNLPLEQYKILAWDKHPQLLAPFLLDFIVHCCALSSTQVYLRVNYFCLFSFESDMEMVEIGEYLEPKN